MIKAVGCLIRWYKYFHNSLHIRYSTLSGTTPVNDELEAFITQAMLEVERDLSLPANSMVDATPLPEMKEKVTLKTLEVRLDPQFMATIPVKYTHHSKELRLRKKVAEQEKTVLLLTSTLELQQKT